MPPRFAYWTILIDNAPTAFRAASRDDLLPTLHQLQRKNADVVMKWFARGRLWDSPEAAQAAAHAKMAREKRGRDWRPGGEHRDPRARFDKKAHKRQQREARGERKPGDARRPQSPVDERGHREQRPWRPKPPGQQRPWRPKPAGPRGPWRPKSAGQHQPWRPKAEGSRQPWRPKSAGPQRPWKPKGPDRPWQPKGHGPQANADQTTRRRRRDDDETKPKEPKRG